MTSARPVPHDREFERAILGAVLTRPEVLEDVLAEGLAPEDFYFHEHERLFALLLNMRDLHEPIDAVTVPERVRRTGEADKFGGIAYVVDLDRAVVALVNTAYYARRVHDFANRRLALAKLEELEDEIREAAGGLPFVAEQVVALLAARDPDLEHQLVAYLTAGAEPILDREALRRVWMAVGERWGWTRAPERMAAK
jgi:replicative DNA helicase